MARSFRLRYRNDPAGFVRRCIEWPNGQGPTAYQVEILGELMRHPRLAVRAPHTVGKTALAAWAVLWFALTRDGEDWKAPTTASVYRQLSEYLWPEIHKWARRIKWPLVGRPALRDGVELLDLSLQLRTGSAFAVASSEPAYIEGAHADRLLYIADEAKTIPDATFDAIEGAFAGGGAAPGREALGLTISTAGEPHGRFYDICRRAPGCEGWRVRAISAVEAMDAGRMDRGWYESCLKLWGENDPRFRNRVLGEFAASAEDGIIPLAWVEAAQERWHEWVSAGRSGELTRLGVDVGRGGDRSVIALRVGNVIAELRRMNQPDVMRVTGAVAALLQAHPGVEAVVDVIGIGAGVVDRLREQKLKVAPFNAGEHTDLKDRSGEIGFVNLRAAAWWGLRELLDPANGEGLALPPDDMLTGDLTAPRWREVSGGKLQVEAKDDIVKRIGRSTDDGDAVVMAFATQKRSPEVRVRWV